MFTSWWNVGAGFAVVVVAFVGYVVYRGRLESKRLKAARDLFHLRREWLEAYFVTLASSSGKPRGLAWTNVEFDDEVTMARDVRSGQLTAFVGVTISFEAIEGGGMEDVEAVGNLRAATAVFRTDGDEWTTDGLALFNVNPDEAVERFRHEVERVLAPRRG